MTMGTGQSLVPDDTIVDNALSDISSGYNSDSLSELPQNKSIKMAKPPLRSKPSLLIGAMKQEQDQQNELEKEVLQKAPGLKKVFIGFKDCLAYLQDNSKRQEKYYMSLDKLLQNNVVDAFNKYAKDEERTVMANKLAAMNFVKPLVDYYDYLYEEVDVDGITNTFFEEALQMKEEGDDFSFPLVLTIREIMWNYSDGSHSFSLKLSETAIFEKMVHDLKMILQDEEGVESFKTFHDLFAFYSSVGILHNCARNPDIDKAKFRKTKVAEALYPFLKSDIVKVKMVSMLAIGNIVTEEEISKFAADVHVIDFLYDAVVKAMKNADRKEHGFHLSELVGGLATIARSEDTKIEIMLKENILAIILEIINGKLTSEVLAAVKLLWELAFLPENKEKIKGDKKLMAVLKNLRNDSDYALKSAVNSIWFILIDKDERKKPEEAEKYRLKKKQKHIMFSYCWSDKEIVLKIYEILSNEGYRIWIDVSNMGQYGNLLEGMAQAIEDAYVVLVCFSEKYKTSQNCRTEADYVYSLRKKIVPLKMQRGYKPDGWLGIFLGAKLYIEFSPHYEFGTQMKKLRESIVPEEQVVPIEPNPNASKENKEHPDGDKVVEWTKKDVEDWIKRFNLESCNSKVLKRTTGQHIDFLYRVMIQSPDTYYRWLETKLELKTIDDLMKFDKALRSLGPLVSF